MVGPAEGEGVSERWRNSEEKQHGPTRTQVDRPGPKKEKEQGEEPEERRDPCAGQLGRTDENAQGRDEVIHWCGGMRHGAGGMIFKIVGAHEGTGPGSDQVRTLHAAVAVTVGQHDQGVTVGEADNDLAAVPSHRREEKDGEQKGSGEWRDDFRHGPPSCVRMCGKSQPENVPWCGWPCSEGPAAHAFPGRASAGAEPCLPAYDSEKRRPRPKKAGAGRLSGYVG